ncbi:HAD-IA family hydrolase [Patescibacteria group bacterium]|nr:HAD-IA family hydrolase [Patescibacteria group bacterium]
MKKRKFEAVLFDMDGTLLDTKEYLFQAYKYSIMRHLKRKVCWKEIAPTLGLSFKECYRILTGLEDVEELMKTHDEFQYQNLHLITAYPNTRKVLKALKLAGVTMGVVTNRYGKQVQESLELAGVRQYFKVVITPEEVDKPKPDPEPIHLALTKLRVMSKETIVVGDSPCDIQAGKNAGCKTIGAGHGYHGRKLVKTEPDYMISDIKDVLPIILA